LSHGENYRPSPLYGSGILKKKLLKFIKINISAGFIYRLYRLQPGTRALRAQKIMKKDSIFFGINEEIAH
jgi:hypothetical protein